MNEKPKRGLAAMSPERRKEIARRGNQKLRESGKVHQYTSETGKAAVLKREENKKSGNNI